MTRLAAFFHAGYSAGDNATVTDRATGKPIVLHDVTVPPKNDAGGAGAASSTLDYARFLQMLANRGSSRASSSPERPCVT